MADPRQANRARALLAHDYQWCQHLTENPPTLTGARPKAMLDIVDMKDVLVLATNVEESAWQGEVWPLQSSCGLDVAEVVAAAITAVVEPWGALIGGLLH